MTDVIALLQASQFATDTGMGKVAPARKCRPAPEDCDETPLKRSSSPPPIIDSGKLPAIQCGVVQASRLMKGFSTVFEPDPLVAF